ncbi:hypothetical protein Tco_1061192 [Tanacetum coccineum]
MLRLQALRLQALGSNTPSGVPYTDEEINTQAQKGKQRGHLPGVGDVEKLKKKNKYLIKQVNLMMKLFRSDDKFAQMLNQYESTPKFGSRSGGCEDDEMADDEDGGEDEEDEEDGDTLSRATCRPGKLSTVALISLTEIKWAPQCRSGKSPGKESLASFPLQFIPGDKSPGIGIPSDKSPEKAWICRWG